MKAARKRAPDLLASHGNLRTGLECGWTELLSGFLDLEHFGFRHALDLLERLAGRLLDS